MVISSASGVVFLFLDLLDALFCVLFKLMDEFLEGEGSSCCYCYIESGEEKRDMDNELYLSTTLYKRRNLFRKVGFCGNVSRRKMKEDGRWSDCSCDNCVAWMSNVAGELKLHVVVQEPEHLQDFKCKKAENVVFLHGFLSSSTFWIETIFPNLLKISPKPNNCLYTIKDHVEMVESSVIHPFELNSFHIVAHSMGCVLALALAAKHCHLVRSITLIAPEPIFMAVDFTRHTHHSAWYTMHNVICGGAKLMDNYLETLKIAKVKINVIQGSRDQVVPIECSNNVKMKVPDAEVKIADNADHTSIIMVVKAKASTISTYLVCS
ncbi:unnamed protein product [Withania somnifera]